MGNELLGPWGEELASTGETEDIITALKSGSAKIADLDQFSIEYYTKKK